MTRYFTALAILFIASLVLPAASRAGDALGTVTQVQDITCPAGGLSPSTCKQLTIACPNTTPQPMMVKINNPTGTSLGTVIFILGSGGLGFYDTIWTYGSQTVRTVLGAGYTTVQFNWGIRNTKGNVAGWLQGPGGPRLLACRFATAAQWVQNTIYSTGAFCSTGNSGGAAAIAYALDDYGLQMDFAEFTSGPAFSRIDWGCDNVQPFGYSPATGLFTTWAYPPSAAYGIVDPSYQNSDCFLEDRQQITRWDPMFFNDSILWSGANYNFSAATHFVYGSLDTGNIPVQGYAFEQAIHSTDIVVPGAPHEIGDTLAGAEQISTDLLASCRKP